MPTKFIQCIQDWKDANGDNKVTHINVMAEDGSAHCRVSSYDKENCQVISDVYVTQENRCKGLCNEMLDYVEENLISRKHILVYVDESAQEFIRRMYDKRGYIILNT